MNIPVKLIRSNRKTLAIQITPTGEVVVKAPLKISDAEIERFLTEKTDWINKKIETINDSLDRFNDITSYKKLLVYGKPHTGIKCSVKKITLSDGKILVPHGIDDEKLTKKIISWYKKEAKAYLTKRTNEISSATNLYPSSIKITGSRGRWGACTNLKTVSYNWRTICLPPAVIDYVIVHELSHLVELNHSQRFYKVVSRILPNYKILQKELKTYGFLLRLF